MNINYYFLFISVCLIMILFLFKPLEIKQQSFTEVPLFSISFFTMYELDSKGLITLMNGEKAIRYADRYTIDKMDYTDNSKKYIANMKSNSGIYKDDIVYLNGDVVYFRQDGLTFETQKAVYNKKTNIATADGDYVLYKGTNRVTGRELKYNNSLQRVESKDVKAIYQLKESTK
ncbi:LPS export ABC transporter periplasmic protein LptC [Sulfurimonas sp. CVO]|uniref:LPS export ABC transporter periplasmic protein LptC n=2 Tax=Sulfurimonas xiamenensis TaxID=2590021 RepID=A0AAJ4A3N5_9BACT|nr:LPS export ABC transporter periplasmic protein LptC [Sulfurimonas sp. CVO]PLY13571.1 MAG: LPS export ABC transporter periplasmic protein LptC [Sulfurimonas sp.]QFR43302.1 LPS export ABC transporter periplasmic protein LptC [Sulfurimonas xiamenensis]QHG91137.1 LPS export ABC transporter periplasmic protein LptC [Sulfurimonas sp. CVO]